MANIPRQRDVLKHDAMRSAWIQPLAVVHWQLYHKPKVPYCYYKLVTNVIRAGKIHVLSYPWYTVWYTTAVSQSTFRPRTIQFIKGIWNVALKRTFELYQYNRRSLLYVFLTVNDDDIVLESTPKSFIPRPPATAIPISECQHSILQGIGHLRFSIFETEETD